MQPFLRMCYAATLVTTDCRTLRRDHAKENAAIHDGLSDKAGEVVEASTNLRNDPPGTALSLC